MVKKSKRATSGGFTLIELLIVMVIIGILASLVVVTSMRGADRARDARRVQELYQIAHALLQYYTVHGNKYPEVALEEIDCNLAGIDWDTGNTSDEGDNFIKPLIDEGFLISTPKEWTGSSVNGKTCVYRYGLVDDPCAGSCPGRYAILYAACESNQCPQSERPSCCGVSLYPESEGDDATDIAIFLKE